MKKLLAMTMVCVIALTMIGCDSTTGKLSKIKKSETMVVFTDPNFAPFEFLGTGGVQGVDIELAKAIAAELGVEATFTETNFDSILMAIKGGKGDIAISGFTITEERKKSVDFSVPYIKSIQYLILPEGSDIEVMEDLAGKTVGVAKGYTGQFLIGDELKSKEQRQADFEDENERAGVLYDAGVVMKEYNSAMEAALDLKTGRLDVIVMDEYVAKNVVSKNTGIEAKELRYSDGELASEEYGVVVPKGNDDLLEVINDVIRKTIAEDKIREWVVQFSE